MSRSAFEREIALAKAPAWRPEPGGVVSGVIVGTRIGGTPVESDGYGYYPVLVLETPGGEFVALHCFHTLVRDWIAENKDALKKAVKDKTPVTAVYIDEKVTNATKDKAERDQTTYHDYYLRFGTPEDAVKAKPEDISFDF